MRRRTPEGGVAPAARRRIRQRRPGEGAHAAGSQAWLTAAEWNAFIDFAVGEGEVYEAGADVLRAQLASNPDDTLYMGPGLLAGGTLKNGKGNTPDHFGYLDLEAAFGACA